MDRSDFIPPWWLTNGHAQTLWSSRARATPKLARQRERIELPDGDFVDLDWSVETDGPIVLVLHGLSGSSESVYVLSLQKRLADHGFWVAAMNFRGCSGVPNRLARCYHSGETSDVGSVFALLKARQPQRPISVVGFSLGGNVLLKWLGEAHPDVHRAVSVSVPFELARCADRLDLGFSRVYRANLLAELRGYLAAKQRAFDANGNATEAEKLRALGNLGKVRSFWEFDQKVIAPLFGFRDVHDYYAKSSARQFLNRITTPTLIVHAEDDPFVPPDAVPTRAEVSSSVHLQITRHGGHVGFMAAGRCGLPTYWLDRRIHAFLADGTTIAPAK